MATRSQSTLYLTLPESSDISAAASNTTITTLLAGDSELATAFGAITEDVFAYLVYSGMTSTTGYFVPAKDLLRVNATGAMSLRIPAAAVCTCYYGTCKAPAFTVPNSRGGVLTNNAADTIYYRIGRANASGFTIAKPGDSNGDDVQGVPVAAGGHVSFTGEQWPAGTEVHLLGTAASQTVTVQFN